MAQSLQYGVGCACGIVEARQPKSGTSTGNLADQQTKPLDTKGWTPFGGQQHAPPYPGAPYQNWDSGAPARRVSPLAISPVLYSRDV